MVNASSSAAAIDSTLKRESPVNALMRLTENAGLLRTSDGRSYAEVSVRGRSEAMPLKSPAFRDWLIEGYYRACRELPSDWAIRCVFGACWKRSRGPRPAHRPCSSESVMTVTPTATARPAISTWRTRAAGPSGSAPRAGRSLKTTAFTFAGPMGTCAPSYLHPRWLDRPAPALRQSRRSRFPPAGCLDGCRPPGPSCPYPIPALYGHQAPPRPRWPGSSGCSLDPSLNLPWPSPAAPAI